MAPPQVSITSTIPDSPWYHLVRLCQKEKNEDVNDHGSELTMGYGRPGYFYCPVGTLRFEGVDCSPCQAITYTCRDTGPRIHKETFCPVGARYPDDRNLPGDPSSGYGKDNVVTQPQKSCPQIRRETIRKLSILWKQDCVIQTNGYVKELLDEVGPHCGLVQSICPKDGNTPVSKQQQICVKTMGTWESSMRSYLLELSPACVVEGTGRTKQWWDYYQAILRKETPAQVYPSLIMTSGEDEDDPRIDITELVNEYRYQSRGWQLSYRAPDLTRYARTIFYLNEKTGLSQADIATRSMREILKQLCIPVRVRGDYVEGGRSSAGDDWVEAVMARADSALICPL